MLVLITLVNQKFCLFIKICLIISEIKRNYSCQIINYVQKHLKPETVIKKNKNIIPNLGIK